MTGPPARRAGPHPVVEHPPYPPGNRMPRGIPSQRSSPESGGASGKSELAAWTGDSVPTCAHTPLPATAATRQQRTVAPLPPPALQFTDFARAEQRLGHRRRAELDRFWSTELEGIPLLLDLPYDRPRPDLLSGRGASHTWVVDGSVMAHVEQTALRLGTTSYTVLAAAFATWMATLCGRSTDIVLAASSANRLRPELAGVVGLPGDAVLLRARLGEAETFADLASRLGSTLFTALDHQDLPLADVADLVAPGTSDGLFPNVLFTVVNTPPPALDLHKLSTTVRSVSPADVARNELYAVLIPHDGRMTVTFEYSVDLFDRTTIESWAMQFTGLLRKSTADPTRPLRELLRPEADHSK